MLYKTLKCATLVILFAAIGACDAGDLTGPDFSPDLRAACVPEGSERGADSCEGVPLDSSDEDQVHPKPAL